MAKPILKPGNVYTIEEFSSSLRKSRGQKKRFIKENGEGFYSYAKNMYIDEDTVKQLLKIVKDEENIYKHFNAAYMPFDIKIEKVGEDVEDVKSSNIYSLMAARTITHFKGSFKVKINFSAEPITVVNEFSENTTLSMRDIVSFM